MRRPHSTSWSPRHTGWLHCRFWDVSLSNVGRVSNIGRSSGPKIVGVSRSEVDVKELDPSKIRDISPEALDGDGRLKVLPAAYWAGTTPDERALFGVNHGLY